MIKKSFLLICLFLTLQGLALAQEGDQTYQVSKEGVPIGALRFFWGGSNFLHGSFQNQNGITTFQDNYDGNQLKTDWQEEGKTKHAEFSISKEKRLFFHNLDVHHLLFLKSLLPKKEGEFVNVTVLNPHSGEEEKGILENRGYKLIKNGKQVVKYRYYILALAREEVDIYQDRDKEFVYIEIPQEELTFRLSQYQPVSYPLESWETPSPYTVTPSSTANEILIKDPTGKDFASKLFVPSAGNRLPAALLLGNSDANKRLLDPLGLFLANHGIMALRDNFVGTEDATSVERVKSVFHFLRFQPNVDPGHVIVIAFDEGNEDAKLLLENSLGPTAAIFLSPSSQFFEKPFLPQNKGTALFLAQGERESLALLDQSRQWVQAAHGMILGEVVWKIIPGVDHDFRVATHVPTEISFNNLPGTTTTLFQQLESWLESLNLIK